MDKVINGKLYNTDTAKLLGQRDNGYLPTDFNWSAESLYRTKSGQYFIHGEGGANTIYGKPAEGGGWTAGERIIPISEEAAKKWTEENLSGEEYSKIWGAPEEKEFIGVAVTPEFKADLTEYCKKNGLKITEATRKALKMLMRE